MFPNFFEESEFGRSGRQRMQWRVGSVPVRTWGELSKKVCMGGPHVFQMLPPTLWFLPFPPVTPLTWAVSPSLCRRLESDLADGRRGCLAALGSPSL